jgi:hypothetical protein
MIIKANTRTFFVFFVFIYFLIFPIGFEVLGESGKYVNNYDISSYNNHFIIFYFSIQAILGFIIGLKISRFETCDSIIPKPTKVKSANIAIIVNALVSILVALLFFIEDIKIVISGYENNYGHSFNSSGFSFLKLNFYVCLSLLISYSFYYNNKSKGLFYFSLLVFLGFITSDKNPIVLGVLAVVSNSYIYSKGVGLKKSILIIFYVLIFLVFTKLFSLFRSSGVGFDELVYVLSNFKLTNIDGAGPYFSIIYLLENPTEYYGITYLNDIFSIIPKFIYHERPDGTSLLFAKDVIKNWNAGEGLGFSPIAEGLNNFGYHMVVFHFLIVGIFWGWWWTFVHFVIRILFKSNIELYYIFYRVVGVYLLLMFFRGSGLGFIKSSLYALLPILFVHIIIYMVFSNEKKSNTMGS